MPIPKVGRRKIFVSYSHTDSEWLTRVQIHLKDLMRRGLVELWDDTKIQSGAQWREEIKSALESVKVAVLLISADFIASDFIAEDELPTLLAAAEKDGVRILSLILSPSRYEKIESLSKYQSVNPPSKPLAGLPKVEQEAYLVKLSNDILRTIEAAQEKSTAIDAVERPQISNQRDAPKTEPLCFLNSEQCLQMLLKQVWEFPECGGSRSSWAVKESDILRGELNHSIERPGLGIALFTTELASEVFGSNATAKINACVDWGLSKTAVSAPHLLTEEIEYRPTGKMIDMHDFRHTIALAILMIRSGTHNNHQKHYLEIVLDSSHDDGGWPAILGAEESESDLAATVYAVEFLATFLKSFEVKAKSVENALQGGVNWLILAAMPDGGWSSRIFPDKSWDRLWSTAYIIQRLFAAELPLSSEWSQTLIDAEIALLHDALAIQYQDSRTQFRVEARVAAALAWSLKVNVMPLLLQERVESWLREWEHRLLETIKILPAKECDLATATFAARALLRGKISREFGARVIAEAAKLAHP